MNDLSSNHIYVINFETLIKKPPTKIEDYSVQRKKKKICWYFAPFTSNYYLRSPFEYKIDLFLSIRCWTV